MSTNVDRRPSERVDVCVIGAGVAGGMTAYSLAKRGYDVVLLDAGPWFDRIRPSERVEKAVRPEHDRTEVWEEGIDPERDAYTTSLPDNIGVDLNRQRLKGIGGTTHHWGANVGRLHEKDFNMHSRYGLAADWPIDYDDLRPYYAEVEAEMGVSGGGDNPFVPREVPPPNPAHPLSHTDELFQAACERLGIRTHSNSLAINSEVYDGRTQCQGYGTCRNFCPSGAKYTGDVHVRKAIDEGVRVIDRVPVQRLEHDRSGNRVEAVVYLAPDGTEYRQRARQFVVACGGIETPRLLLLSDSERYPNGLANSSGAVGRYLFFTPFIIVRGELAEPIAGEPKGFNTLISDQFYDHEDPQPGSVHLTFDTGSPDLVGGVVGGSVLEKIEGISWGDELVDDLEKAVTLSYRKIAVGASLEMIPRKTNRVSLNHDVTDNYGNPVPDISVDVGPHSIETGDFALPIMQDIVTEMGAEVTSVGDARTQTVRNHHKGTTRMGDDPAESVVDSRLRTHDLANLWIASSSVFTTGGAYNPTLTIAALSLKAADHIAEVL